MTCWSNTFRWRPCASLLVPRDEGCTQRSLRRPMLDPSRQARWNAVRRRAWLMLLLWCGAVGASAAETNTLGESIYRQGVLPSGAALHGAREAGIGVEGMAAACITCHRSSGLGTTEGRIVVPPIIGKYLFRAHST